MRIRTVTSLAILCAGATALVGCGSSATHTPTRQARATPAQSNHDVGTATAQTNHSQPLGADAVGSLQSRNRIGPQTVQKARPTPATTKDETNTAPAGTLNPCRLVSLADAQTITSGAVSARIEAPLGPTCIYKQAGSRPAQAGSRPAITLAVETQSFAQASHQMRKRSHVTVAGRQAYCGRLGTQVLLVPLAQGRLLDVTAPCAIAQRFAALALSHLAA